MPESVNFTKRQAAHVEALLRQWVATAAEKGLWGNPVLAATQLLLTMETKETWDKGDFDWLTWFVALALSQLEEDEVDPLLEQVYGKLTGYWYRVPPWYDRVRTLTPEYQLPPIGT